MGIGYSKYRIDTAGTALWETTENQKNTGNESESAVSAVFSHLGYSGFLGAAQDYYMNPNFVLIGKMQDSLKAADKAIASLSGTQDLRKKEDLQAIYSMFFNVLGKIELPFAEEPEEDSSDLDIKITASASEEQFIKLTPYDLLPLSSALLVVEKYRADYNKASMLTHQREINFWSGVITIFSIFALLSMIGCIFWVNKVVRLTKSPLTSLTQSIQNMSHGDMRTAIWGIERQDLIGELARSIDMARYHFSHMPDISVMSDQGPVRLRFEGGSRSLFEAMMKSLSGDSEVIREKALAISSTFEKQSSSMEAASSKIDSVFEEVSKLGKRNDQILGQAVRDMTNSMSMVKNAHANAADQFGSILPSMKEKVDNLADITKITGKLLTRTLQAIMSGEISLRANLESSSDTLKKLSSTADELGQRLFGAINLFQASGKVLSETTTNVKNSVAALTKSTGTHDYSAQFTDMAKAVHGLQNSMKSISGNINIPDYADKFKEIEEAIRGIRRNIQDSMGSIAIPDYSEKFNEIEKAIQGIQQGVQDSVGEVSKPTDVPNYSSQLSTIGVTIKGIQDSIVSLSESMGKMPSSEEINSATVSQQNLVLRQIAALGSAFGGIEREVSSVKEQNSTIVAAIDKMKGLIASHETHMSEGFDRIASSKHTAAAEGGDKIKGEENLTAVIGTLETVCSLLLSQKNEGVQSTESGEELSKLSSNVSNLAQRLEDLAALNIRSMEFTSMLPGDVKEAIYAVISNLADKVDENVSRIEELKRLNSEIRDNTSRATLMLANAGATGKSTELSMRIQLEKQTELFKSLLESSR
ncbi:MAG: methyl-accepting chemotaxis protein [Alphaproteobacteria bacterium]|nr:methyl-accepting chemotaxis protein [Alphaproteobacteria bacterium]MCL2504960.1 methyl-accepting chemotaxis protein [Alphaproteobacteria bacterium]